MGPRSHVVSPGLSDADLLPEDPPYIPLHVHKGPQPLLLFP